MSSSRTKADIRQSHVHCLEKPDQLLSEQLVLLSHVRFANRRIHVHPLAPRVLSAIQEQQTLPWLQGWKSPCDSKPTTPCAVPARRFRFVVLCEVLITHTVKERVEVWREL